MYVQQGQQLLIADLLLFSVVPTVTNFCLKAALTVKDVMSGFVLVVWRAVSFVQVCVRLFDM
jgi:hypothetical protein